MQLQRTIITRESPTSARDLVTTYMTRQGYRAKPIGQLLVFERGGFWGAFSFAVKHWRTTARVQTAPAGEGQTAVVVELDVNTTGQMITGKELPFLEKELAEMAAALGGEIIRPSASVAGLEAALADRADPRTQNQARSGANWFLFIAGMSVINSLIVMFGGSMNFLVGLGATQVVDGVTNTLVKHAAASSAPLIHGIALLIDLCFAGLFLGFGLLARRGLRWAFIVGMVVYALDGLIFIWAQDWLSFGFHCFVLVGIFNGMRASQRAAPTETGRRLPA